MASQIFAVSPLLSVLSGAGLSSGVGSGAKRAWAGVGLGKHNAAIAAMITLQTTRMAFLLRAERFLRDIEPATLRSQVVSLERARCRRRYRDKRREISLCAGRRFRKSECARKNRPAPFEMTVVPLELSQAAFWNLSLAVWARGEGKLETRRQKFETR